MPNTLPHKTLKSGIESNMSALIALQDQKRYALKAGTIDEFYARIDKRDDALRLQEETILCHIGHAGPNVRAQLFRELKEVMRERAHLDAIDDRLHIQDRQANKVIKDTNSRASFLVRQSNHILECLTRPLSVMSRSKRAV